MNEQKLDLCIALLQRIAEALEAAVPSRGDCVGSSDTASPYVSPDVPAGYDTVVGYFANNLPSAFDMMDDPITETMRDGFWLTHQASKRGLRVVKVKAPTAFEAAGIDTLNAYPIELLRERIAA